MISGMSFSRGVFFHDTKIIACGEVKDGVIHLWAEKITWRTLFKLWVRIVFTLPWAYQLFHLGLLLYYFFPVFAPINGWLLVVYLIGFHFVFPLKLKKFHGAEHKVFSYGMVKSPNQWQQVNRASIVNRGCSTNFVTYFFVCFLPVSLFFPLHWGVLAGFCGIALGTLGVRFAPKYMRPLFRLSAWLQRYVTTSEPDRLHLDTAIRSYLLFQQFRLNSQQHPD